MHKIFDNIFAGLMLAAGVAVVLAGTWVLSHFIEQARREPPPARPAQTQGLPAESVPVLCGAAAPTRRPGPDDSAIPLDKPVAEALAESCEEYGVPLSLALGVIEVESGFQADAVSAEGCYGLCQLNPRYFPEGLSPADNVRHGMRFLGELLERHGDTAAALTAYNAGWDTGDRTYAEAVLAAAERWDCDE